MSRGWRWITAVVGAFSLVLGGAGAALADYVQTGTHPWLVVLCHFSDEQVAPGGAAGLALYQQEYTNAGAGSGQYNFVDYWHDVSFGQLSVAGTTIAHGSHADANGDGWYTVPKTRDTWGYTENRAQKIIDCANAAEPDVNYANYYGVIAVFPEGGGRTISAMSTSDTTVTLDSSATSPTPTDSTTNYFPAVPFMMNISDCQNASETVKVTAMSGNQLTVSRGANGTTPITHPANSCWGIPGDYGEVNVTPVGTPPGQSHVTLGTNTYNLALVILPNENNLTGLQHETGHGFGYSHSRRLSYSTTDYKDATDDMSAYDSTYEFTTLGTTFGGSVLGSLPNDKGPGLTAINLDAQGWIPAPRQYLFSAPNQATISLHTLSDPNALSATGYLEAQMPASVAIENASPNDSNGNPLVPTNPPTCSGTGYSCTTSQHYSIDYRQATGWDSGFPANSVELHLLGGDQRAYWVDQTPLGHNGLLYAGDEFADPTNNTYIAVNSTVGSTAQVTLASQKIVPQLSYSGDSTADFNDVATLAADLTVGGAPVPGKTVTLTLGTQGCTRVTNATGHVSCQITINQHAGPYTAIASFAGDTVYTAETGSSPFTVNLEDTQLTYSGATNGDYHDPATVSAVLTDATDGTPIANKTVDFQIGASDTCSAQTTGTGTASCTITPTQPAGPYPMTASFAGDSDYAAASDTSHTFTVTKEQTTTTYTGPTVILQGSSGVTLTGLLLEDGNPTTPITGRTLTLGLGSQSCTGTTDATGTASCTLTFTGPLGPQPLTATFAGDGYYLPSSDTSQSAVVFAFPSSGAFVMGDTSVASASPGGSLTWWGAQWAARNDLTGGAAPPAFKGFASTVTLPTSTPPAACGSAWTTGPGNSAAPPSTVPGYMGVLVTSHVTKHGALIGGDTVGIIVVRVDPGYAANPGHPGTGTIVARYC